MRRDDTSAASERDKRDRNLAAETYGDVGAGIGRAKLVVAFVVKMLPLHAIPQGERLFARLAKDNFGIGLGRGQMRQVYVPKLARRRFALK